MESFLDTDNLKFLFANKKLNRSNLNGLIFIYLVSFIVAGKALSHKFANTRATIDNNELRLDLCI